jgi:hypothetical protein
MRKQQLPWVGWVVTVLSIMACQAVQAVDIKLLPEPHPVYRCRPPPNLPAVLPTCGADVFIVQAFAIKDVQQNVTACVAAFPYNELIMRTGPTGAAAPFTLRWKLPAGGDFFFAAHGMALTPAEDKVHEDLFDPPRPDVIDKRYTVTLTVKAGVTKQVKFDHLPIVLYRQGGPGLGDKLRCVGIDPVIVNNAD